MDLKAENAYETDLTTVIASVTNLSIVVRNHALQSALARYDRGAIVAAFVDRYGERGQADVARIAADVGVHTATLYEDIAVYRSFPVRSEFSHQLAAVRSWSGITRLLPPKHKTAQNGHERALHTDTDCSALERTGMAIERIASDPPADPVHRTEIAATLTALAREAIQTAVTLDPAMALEPSFVSGETPIPWSGAFAEAFDESPLSKTDRAMFDAWVDMRGGVDVDDYAKVYRALMRVMENPREPMSRKGR